MQEKKTGRPRILMIAAELAPWIKVGGLGDVMGALPAALTEAGAEVFVAVPGYRQIGDALKSGILLNEKPLVMSWGYGRDYHIWLRCTVHPAGFPVLFVDCPELFDREGIYKSKEFPNGYPDSLVRWSALCRGALFGGYLLGGEWDVVHAHDMHAALALPLLREEHIASTLTSARAVLSIHNLAYQGIYPLEAIQRVGLDSKKTQPFGPYEFYGRLNCLKAGIEYADGILTVSPTYANEIVDIPEYGHGLQGVLRYRRDFVTGILNGIDTKIWDPETDPVLPAKFDVDDLSGKAICKAKLQESCGWTPDPNRLVMGVVSRLTEQKGLDLLLKSLPELVAKDIQLVVLGNGNPQLEKAFSEAAAQWPESVCAHITFNEGLAHYIQAGADLFIIPSRFEPCGLAQMYAMRYGTLPVGRNTGGLSDTIIPFNDKNLKGTGFLFEEATPEALTQAILKALQVWDNKEIWTKLMKQAMVRDFSWKQRALEYLEWYNSIDPQYASYEPLHV